ncbi:MAG: hypothetical protein HYT87_16205 [Nitrospirae bacterium]|nr:hypothetical protein [Nitrospirota bacterium]
MANREPVNREPVNQTESENGLKTSLIGLTGSRDHGITRLLLTAYCLLFTLAGCADEDKPRVGVECSTCHDYAALTAARGSDADGPREWLGTSSKGLLARTSPFTGLEEYVLDWPRRGRHPAFTLEPDTCFTCHPVTSTGSRHSLDAYPPGVTESKGDCASSCHLWLPNQVRSSAHPDLGTGGTYDGPGRPYEMLTQTRTRHTDVFEKGYPADKPRKSGAKVQFIAPGCVGCHSFQDPRHGTIATCTDCHSFATKTPEAASGQGLHELHLMFIQSKRSSAMPSNCSVCHGYENDQTLSNAMCYNCHVSGHNPTTAFWP